MLFDDICGRERSTVRQVHRRIEPPHVWLHVGVSRSQSDEQIGNFVIETRGKGPLLQDDARNSRLDSHLIRGAVLVEEGDVYFGKVQCDRPWLGRSIWGYPGLMVPGAVKNLRPLRISTTSSFSILRSG